MRRKPKQRIVLAATASAVTWWRPRHSAPPHRWIAEFNGEVFVARCSECAAELRVEVGASEDQVVLVGYVMHAGTGVRVDEVEWFCDQVADDLQRRGGVSRHRQGLADLDLRSTRAA